MPAKKLPLPPVEKLLDLAGGSTSFAKLAEAIGWKPNSLRARLEAEGVLAEVVAAVKGEALPFDPLDVSEAEVWRQRAEEAERAFRAKRKEDVFEERALSVLEGAVKARKPSPLRRSTSKRSGRGHEFVLLWSDLHAGEVVSAEETNGLGSYDWRTMLARLERLREGLLSYRENRPYPVDRLWIAGLGDMLSGDIHDELVETNEVPLAEATVQLGLDGAEWLDSIASEFPEVRFAGVVGNHPRSKRKPQAKRGFDNADWLAYNVMRLALRRNERIAFEIPKATQWPIVVAEKWRLLLWHGDGVRSSMPGVPWGGVMRRAAALQNQYTAAGQPIDCFCVGHFHTANLVEGSAGRIAMNGSVKGVDEYSLKAFGGARAPQQLLLTFHPGRGLTDCSLIDLEPARPASGAG